MEYKHCLSSGQGEEGAAGTSLMAGASASSGQRCSGSTTTNAGHLASMLITLTTPARIHTEFKPV